MPICKRCEHDLANVVYSLWWGRNWRRDLGIFVQLWALMTMMLRLFIGYDLSRQSQLPNHERLADSTEELYVSKRPVPDIYRQRHLCWCCSHIWLVYLRWNEDANPFSDDETLGALVQKQQNVKVTILFSQCPDPEDSTISQIICSVFVPRWTKLLLPIPAYKMTLFHGSQKAIGPGVDEEEVYRFEWQDRTNGPAGLVLQPEGCGDVVASSQSLQMAKSVERGGIDEARMIRLIDMMDECRRLHETCRSRNSSKRLPSRLLDLRGHGPCVFLVPTSNIDHSSIHSYATLSHCWGKKEFLTLLSSNYNEMLRAIPIVSLAKTFRDSIAICRRLGIGYLWIDSLCIMQDSKADWEAEAPRMYDVYSNSTLNLAATTASSSINGMFEAMVLYNPILIKLPNQTELHFGEMKKNLDLDRLVSYSPLLSRGWVLQELCISPRVLHVTQSMLIWHCAEKIFSMPSKDQKALEGLESFKLHRFHPESLGQRGLDQLWRQLVQEYSREKLSFRKDKMIAISGLAATFDVSYARLKFKTRYCAGIWEHDLLRFLAWYPSEAPKRALSSPTIGIPSWSWLCVDDAVIIPNWLERVQDGPCETIYTSEITGVTLQTEVPNHAFGQLSEGQIRIRGPVIYLRRRTIHSVFAETYRDFLSKLITRTGASYPLPIRMMAWAWHLPTWPQLFFKKLYESDGLYSNIVLTNGKGREITFYQFDQSNRAICRFDRPFDSVIGRVFKCVILGHHLIPCEGGKFARSNSTNRQIVALILDETTSTDGLRLYKRCGQLQITQSLEAEPQEHLSERDKSTSRMVSLFFQRERLEEEELVLV